MDVLVDHWLTLPELAAAIGEPLAKVRQLLKEGRLVAVRRGDPATLAVPACFVHEGRLAKGLGGTITLLRDGRYGDEEILRWLLTPDESLPGRPIDALAGNRGTEVKRRAQAMAL